MTRHSPLAIAERHVTPTSAIRQLTVWARQRRLDWDSTTLWEGRRPQRGPESPIITRVELASSGVRIGEGTGKGLGRQAVASGMYEAFEHLVSLSDESLPDLRPGEGDRSDRSGRRGRRYVPRSALSEVAERDALGHLLRGPAGPPTVAAVEMHPAADAVEERDSPAELLPAALVDLSYIPPEDHTAERLASWYCTNNGIAAGLSPTDTILHALYEVIERDALGALLASVMAETPHGRIVTIGNEHRLGWLARCIEDDFGTDIEVRRLPSLAAHVVVAISATTDARGCVVLGCGASSCLAYAVERALLELAQNLVAEVRGEPFSADGLPDSLERLHRFPNLLAAARLDRLPPLEGTIALREDGRDFSRPVPSVKEQTLTALEALSTTGFQAYARPLYRSSSARALAPQVWQVTVPGVERFHLVRLGLPVEPTGRLRTKALITLARQSIDRFDSRSTHGSDVVPLS